MKPEDDLTLREQQVLELLADGLCNKEIAATLGCSPSTVQVHLTHIFNKLGVDNRVKAARRYWERYLRAAVVAVE